MMAHSTLALAFAVLAIAVLAWNTSWVFGLLLTVIIVVHELGHVLAARWYGHTRSSFVFVPFVGGLANVGPSATQKEHVVKTLAGPAFGLLACLACYVLLPPIYPGDGFELFVGLGVVTLVHGLNLLPIGVLDGGQVMRSLIVSTGRNGRRLWAIVGGVGLLAGVYLVWRFGGIGAWAVIGVSALALHADFTAKGGDGIAALGPLGMVATVIAQLALILGHVAAIALLLMYAPSTTRLTIALPDAALVEGVSLQRVESRVDDLLFARADRQGWNPGENLLRSSSARGDRIEALVPAGRYVLRVRLRDSKECQRQLTLFATSVARTIDRDFLSDPSCR